MNEIEELAKIITKTFHGEILSCRGCEKVATEIIAAGYCKSSPADVEAIAKKAYYLANPKGRDTLPWGKYGLKKRYYDFARQLSPMLPVPDEKRISEFIDRLLVEDALIVLGFDKSKVLDMSNWPNERVEAHYNLRQKAISALLSFLPQKEIKLEKKVAEHCTSGRHKHHTFIPWFYDSPYDKFCNICGEKAAWVAGNNVVLCDCHAEDWSRWTEKDGRLHESKAVKSIWMILFNDFKRDVDIGKFKPDDFSGLAACKGE